MCTSINYVLRARFFSSSKFGVPNPVTGSQPTVAFHEAYLMCPPFGIRMPFCKSTPVQPREPPSVMSFSALPAAQLYSQGLMKPIDGFPARKRASFMRAITAAKTGAAAEVPPAGPAVPFVTVR